MKSPVSNPVFLLLAFAGLASADLPKKVPLTRYSGLWVNSPFTSKPLVQGDAPVNNPLDEYALIGVSPIGGAGYRVTLINKKKPDERITVDSDSAKTGFKILEVIRKAGDPLGTVVRMSSGSMSGTVSFDQKLLTLAAAPAAKAPGQPPGQAAQPNPPGQQQPPPGQANLRQPRARVVPPPAAPPGGQVQPNQPNQPNQRNNPRPPRRGY